MKKILMFSLLVFALFLFTTPVFATKPTDKPAKSQGSYEKVTGDITATSGGATFWMEISAYDTNPVKGYVTYSNSLGGYFEGKVDCYNKISDDIVVFGGKVNRGLSTYPGPRFAVQVKNGSPDTLRVRASDKYDCALEGGFYGRVTGGDIVIQKVKKNNNLSGEAEDPDHDWLGMIKYLGNKPGYHFWFTPTESRRPYVANHSYHNVYKLEVEDTSEWCGPVNIPNRAPYNLVGHTGKTAYYKIWDVTTDTLVCP